MLTNPIPKSVKVVITTLLGLSIALFCLHFFKSDLVVSSGLNSGTSELPSLLHEFTQRRKGRLHLLIPATSSNSDLCKLLLSAQILGYPTPVLINYGDHENGDDPYVQHLQKINGVLSYLEHLKVSDEYSEDLVLVLDGYDVWLQLRPDVLIKRFHALNAEADARALKLYGVELVQRYDIRQRIVFGPDKLCWPVDFSRSACWAVPETPLRTTAFGPTVEYEDRNKNDARWLNSGTIMGNAKDLQDLFRATLEAIHHNHTTDSDQFYFANIFGEQEYARIRRVPELLKTFKSKSYFDKEDSIGGSNVRVEPEISNRTEYHIGIDYTSTMFQTFAYWKQHLTWTRVVNSWQAFDETKYLNDPRRLILPPDIEQSLTPFEPLQDSLAHRIYPNWSEVNLAYNAITKQFPVALHFTGNPDEKRFRAWWWQKLWYQSTAEELMNASQKSDYRVIAANPINGLQWFNAEPGDVDEFAGGGKTGAWSDRGGWLSWKRLCKSAEADIYNVPGEDFFHPDSQPVP